MIIQTERIRIREIIADDIDCLLAIYQDSENMKFIPNSAFKWNKEQLTEKYERINCGYKKGFGIFTVELLDGEIIGEGGLFDSFNKLNHLELGYIIDRRYWGKGYGLELCKSLIEYGFRELKLSKLTARMYKENIASVRLSERCGMAFVNGGKNDDGKEYCEYEISANELNTPHNKL
nr:GNAT family N-acetyltransferase [uncultured Marinifilum sp.]